MSVRSRSELLPVGHVMFTFSASFAILISTTDDQPPVFYVIFISSTPHYCSIFSSFDAAVLVDCCATTSPHFTRFVSFVLSVFEIASFLQRWRPLVLMF